MTLENWPLTAAQVRDAVGFAEGQGSDADFEEVAAWISEKVDRETGRHVDPLRWVTTTTEDVDGVPTEIQRVPVAFVMAAKVSARLLYQQEKNGPRGQPEGGPGVVTAGRTAGVPMSADLPAKAKAWLRDYPSIPGIA